MPGETVGAAIKKYNLYDVTKTEMEDLLREFTDINGVKNFTPGTSVLIPILLRHQAEAFGI
jgi:hypothetical protein